ncbi:hypothetical protein WOLCODRAFT_115184 [Wolfiporia cocos MD-104 SS10]|uniref:Enhancer of mRNA-decapping protein 4 WD40 repeat region domain-containing protein n=1 Tax=Wolfiporia cocos (strain MD-104) TaxID=742152 RepID=A0A2H3JQJ0_WOLCO|nr:hypothetical protein WOLCODRAFT_115184 [Wolfiporia cocos MD-104 SS10]
MDPITGRDNVFSRGPSPPPNQQSFQLPPTQLNDPQASPVPSLRDPPPATSSTNHLDHLFHTLNAPSASHVSPQPSNSGSNIYAGPQEHPNSGPATPASVNAGSVSSSMTGPNTQASDRQNALLSLLGTVSGPPSNNQGNTQINPNLGGQVPPQQVPTPPGSAQRALMSNNESQGKLLLEQLMSGAAPTYSNYPDPIYPSNPPPASGSSASYSQPLPPEPLPHHEQREYTTNTYASREQPREASDMLGPPLGQPRAPSPSQRSMFDFVSPFDALANASSSVKRKPPPPQPMNAPSNPEEPTWPSLAQDPKRKSVENLMDQLTRGQAPPAAPAQPMAAPYDPYVPSDDINQQAEPVQTRASRPLPPQPAHAPSPPKTHMQPRQQRRNGESPVGSGMYGSGASRDKESPVPGQQFRNTGSDNRGRGGKNKTVSPSSQAQTIVFDVSQPLDEIQAPRDAVKTTAIALVKVDSTFLPGSTIGATHWVAYAMTKGRVRVISRSSGDRTLLQLPPLFPPSTTLSDMSVHGNRLAGVTSDGGFIVWELPEVITDDVPGRVMLCVEPSSDFEPLHAVKWHPQQPDLVAVASGSNVYLINIEDAIHNFNGEPVLQSALPHIAQVYSVQSPIVAIDFDTSRSTLGIICEDSILTEWNINDKLPFWTHRVRGDDLPSSLTFVDGGVVVGRKNGTVFQLLQVMNRHVLSTIKFVNGVQEDPDMFGHVNYDSRIQTLWVANNRRDSMVAVRINFDASAPSPGGEDIGRGAYFDQVLEFGGPKPTIHFVILTADADPTGEEAHAACVAAKVPPGDLALVAFSVHSSGVDQVLIRNEWFNSALVGAAARFPSYSPVPALANDPRPLRQQLPPVVTSAPVQHAGPPQSIVSIPPPRTKTPPSEDVEGEHSRDESGRVQEPRGKNAKGKNVGWKDKDKEDNGREREKTRGGDSAIVNESPLGIALSKEIRKVEENLHTRIGRLIAKELDKQHQRLEDARASEQAADFVRQEKILKLISNELTKNTTRVVEMAVKTEVQSSVLPSLENITKNEIKSTLSNQIAKGMSDSMKQSVPAEVERMLLRADVSTHIARNISTAVSPVIERLVKEAITKTLIPAYTQQSTAMHQELSREIHAEILNLKKEIVTWQSEALRGQETLIRELESSVRMLSEQVKFLTLNSSSVGTHFIPSRSSPGTSATSSQQQQSSLSQILRQQALPPATQPSYGPQGFQQQPQQPQQAPMHGGWYGSSIAAPQASHPASLPQLPQQQVKRGSPPPRTEEWDDTYLAVLSTQDNRQLHELLARSNPDVVMPLNGPSPLSQAVVLTIVHRLSTIVGETSPLDESFKISIWWLQRAASALNTSDPLISQYVSRVLPNVHQMLNTTKQRLSIIPGPPIDATRSLSEIQDIISRKPL